MGLLLAWQICQVVLRGFLAEDPRSAARLAAVLGAMVFQHDASVVAFQPRLVAEVELLHKPVLHPGTLC
jgi:hypothetical protein